MPQPRHTETSILQSYLLPPSPLPTLIPYSSFLQLVPSQHRSHPHLKRLYRDFQFQRNVDVNTVRENIDREVAKSATLKADLAKRIANEQGQRQTRPKSVRGSDASTRKRKRLGTNEDEAHPTQSLDDGGEDHKPGSDGKSDGLGNSVDTALDTTYYTSSLHPSHSGPASQSHPLTSGVTTLSSSGKYHTAGSLLSSMGTAVSDVDSEIADLEAESDRLLGEMKEIVGSLSDLRYGRFARPSSNGETGGRGDGVVESEVVDALSALEKAMRKVQ